MVELAHGGIDNGVAGAPSAPGSKVIRVVGPGDIGIFRLEWFVHAATKSVKSRLSWLVYEGYEPDIGPIHQDMLVEISPCDLTDPGYDTLMSTV